MSDNLLGKTMIRMQTQSLLNQVAIMASLSRLMSQSHTNDDLRKQLQQSYEQTVKMFEEIETDADAAINKPKDEFNQTSAELLHKLGYRVISKSSTDWCVITPGGVELIDSHEKPSEAWRAALAYHRAVGEGA